MVEQIIGDNRGLNTGVGQTTNRSDAPNGQQRSTSTEQQKLQSILVKADKAGIDLKKWGSDEGEGSEHSHSLNHEEEKFLNSIKDLVKQDAKSKGYQVDKKDTMNFNGNQGNIVHRDSKGEYITGVFERYKKDGELDPANPATDQTLRGKTFKLYINGDSAGQVEISK